MSSVKEKDRSQEGFNAGLIVDDDILFDDVYEMREIMSSENWSVTRRCIHRNTCNQCIVKIIELEQFDNSSNKDLESNIEDLKREASICHSLKHPYIVELFETYSNGGVFYMVFEYLSGIDLLHEIVNRALDGFVYSEAVACHYMRQVLEAILYCHDNGIAYRNLQPSCILLADSSNSAPIKLTGFNNAVHLDNFNSSTTTGLHGCPHFLAPEIIQRQPHGKPVDVWSAGIVLYVLLSGQLPYPGTKNQLYCSIVNGAFTMKTTQWAYISDSAKSLISQMLEINQFERLTVEEALSHPWLSDRNCAPRLHLQEAIEGLKNVNSRRDLKEATYFDLTSSFDSSPFDHMTPMSQSSNDWYLKGKYIEDMNSTNAISHVLVMLKDIEEQAQMSNEESSFLRMIFNSNKLQALLRLYDKIGSHTLDCCNKPEPENASKLLREIVDNVKSKLKTDAEKELYSILTKPYFVGFLLAYDNTLREGYGDGTSSIVSSMPRTMSINGEVVDHHSISNNVGNDALCKPNQILPQQKVRMVQFQRNTAEPLGITLRIDEFGHCIVARIMHGGMVHKQGTLHVGDDIREINNFPITGQSASYLQNMLKNLRGSVVLKVVPGFKLPPVPCEIFVRADFSYNPQKDDLIPCKSAGLTFQVGDVLQVTCKDDFNWWQARRVDQSECEPAGLIPSPELQEWRITCSAIGKARREKGYCTWFNRRKKQQRDGKYLVKRNAIFDQLALLTYEEVIRLPYFKHKTLVLLGAHGVGRRHIKNTLIAAHTDKFAYPVPYTTRPIKNDEEEGRDFYFVSLEKMMTDIANNEYLEYGTHEGAMYGTKLDTIRIIHMQGLVAILDVEIQALKILRTSEFAPFIVFIAAPAIPPDNENANLLRLKKDSETMEKSYKHYFDMIIVNNNIQRTIESLVSAVEQANSSPKWVPVSWVY